ncbi:hypothetical protein EKO04_001088 [Neofusicoccum parvum]|uniref:Uncharacterized protein n=1 Tax=Neofusicoccum parvum TaxID=310453 RepID=A0ACB5SD56_9PEZI|nr:hypothetical protein EKO04_001088 [Neofusicoccum parvum]
MRASTIIATILSMGAFVAASPIELESVEVSAPEGAALDKRQCQNTCTVQGFAIVNGARVNFGGTAVNVPANRGRNSDIPNLLPGTSCVLTVVPQCACRDWSVVGSTNCGSSRSVTFS